MPDYRYEGTYPRVFPLEIGLDAEVTPAEGNPPVGPNGSTVYLSHGDILHAKEPIEHAWLKEIDTGGAKQTKPVKVTVHANEPVVSAAILTNAPAIPVEEDKETPSDAVSPAETSTPDPVESSTPAPETPAEPATSPENEENK